MLKAVCEGRAPRLGAGSATPRNVRFTIVGRGSSGAAARTTRGHARHHVSRQRASVVTARDARLHDGRLAGVPRWHARGQGVKSPQLHQAQRICRIPAQGGLAADCQQITSCDYRNALSVDRFGLFTVKRTSPLVTCSKPTPPAKVSHEPSESSENSRSQEPILR
jgi:hypothetical protein